jgi:2-iminobutanoate/2-iminopropanoate deaminase
MARLAAGWSPGQDPAGREAAPPSPWNPPQEKTVKRLALALVASALVSAPVLAQEGPRIAHQPSSRLPFSAAIQVGNTYWLSGKLGVNAETRAMTEGRMAAETHNIMRAFGALLEELGMDFGDLVRATVYLTDIEGYAEMNEAYAQYFQGIDAPSRVAMEVSGLVAGGLVEISFVAVKTD